jgi:hypothetical protein
MTKQFAIARNTPNWAQGARQGELRRYMKLAFFACEGYVVLYDERHPEEDYNVLTCEEASHHAEALRDMGKDMVKAENKPSTRELGRQYLAGASDMYESVAEAKGMGDPTDPAVAAWWSRHRPGRKSRVSLHAGIDRAGYPALPEVHPGKFTGRTAEPGQAAAEFVGPRIRQPARRKQSNKKLILDV